MKIHNQDYIVIMKESVKELSLTHPRVAALMRAHGIKARLYVTRPNGSKYYVVQQYQSGNYGKVTAA
jgi:hypothetical protein